MSGYRALTVGCLLGVVVMLCVTSIACGGGGKPKVPKTQITITSKPEQGAHVKINDQPFGETPVTVKGLAPGAVLVELSLPGYKDQLETVRVPDQGAQSVEIEMRLKVGTISIESNPNQAEVYLDGKTFLGVTPLKDVEVRAGERNFELKKDHYVSQKFSLTIEPDYQYRKSFDLIATKGVLEVYSLPTNANIWLNNQLQPQKTPTKFTLSPGSYTVSVHTAGYISQDDTVAVVADQTAKLDLKLVEGNAPPGMVLIPGGEFQFGVDNQAPDERPKRTLNVDAFYIDKYEVTNADFNAVFKAHKFTKGEENFPVTKVTWDQASAYAQAVNKRLPTEAEWEKAARGTDGREYPWGNLFDQVLANTGAASGAKLREVGQYRPGASPYGCLDMAGNAAEWTSSWYAAYPGNTVIVKEYGQLYRVIRGGSYKGSSFDSRCACRHFDLPDVGNQDYGFRCALSVDEVEGRHLSKP